MKKLLAMLIIGLFAFGAFAGCVGSEESNDVVVPDEEPIGEVQTNETEEPAEPEYYVETQQISIGYEVSCPVVTAYPITGASSFEYKANCKGIQLTVSGESTSPTAMGYNIEIRDADDNIVGSVEGDALPLSITVPAKGLKSYSDGGSFDVAVFISGGADAMSSYTGDIELTYEA